MRRLLLLLMAISFCFAMAAPVSADVIGSPLSNPVTVIVIVVLIPIAAWILFALLRNRKK